MSDVVDFVRSSLHRFSLLSIAAVLAAARIPACAQDASKPGTDSATTNIPQTARAEASKELVHEQTGSSLDYRVSQLTTSSVDEEFARLKENRMKQDANV